MFKQFASVFGSVVIVLAAFSFFLIRQPALLQQYNPNIAQTEIKKPGPLLLENGELNQTGWARGTLRSYFENETKTCLPISSLNYLRIKKWESFHIINEDFIAQIYYANLGYTTYFSFNFVDLKNKTMTAKRYQPFDIRLQNFMNISDDGLYGKPTIDSNHSEFRLKIKSEKISCKKIMEKRIRVESLNPDIQGEFIFEKSFNTDGFSEVAPLSKNKKQFLYSLYEFNQKVEGRIKVNNKWYYINNQTIPTLAFGESVRAVTPYGTAWIVGMGQGFSKNDKIGLNIGGGYADPDLATATRDTIYINDKLFKLNATKINLVTDGISTFKTETLEHVGDCDISFSPFTGLNETFSNNFLYIASSKITRYYGKFEGTVILRGNEIYNFKNVIGFIELAEHKW